MKRIVSIVLVWLVGAAPLFAQGRRFDMSFDVNAAAAREQAAPQQRQAGNGPTAGEKLLFVGTLVAAVGGTVFEIKETRLALDKGFTIRSFPVVWLKTNDPADKGKVTAYLAATNGAMMVISSIAFAKHHPKAAILLNAFVAGLSIGVALHERSVIRNNGQ